MCCSKKVSKLLLVLFNIIFFICGAGVLALGIVLIVDKNFLLDIIGKVPGSSTFDDAAILNTTSFLQSGAYMLIAAGALVFIIGFSGLCGAIRESKCLLAIYATLVFVILIVEIAAGVLCVFYGDDVKAYLLTWIGTLINKYYYGATLDYNNVVQIASDTTGISSAIDYVQISLQCCGATNYTDYDTALNWSRDYNMTASDGSLVNITDPMVPITCCKLNNPTAWPTNVADLTFVDLEECLTMASDNSTNTASCYNEVLDLLHQYTQIAIGIGIGVGLVEIFGIVAACCLIKAKKKEMNGVV